MDACDRRNCGVSATVSDRAREQSASSGLLDLACVCGGAERRRGRLERPGVVDCRRLRLEVTSRPSIAFPALVIVAIQRCARILQGLRGGFDRRCVPVGRYGAERGEAGRAAVHAPVQSTLLLRRSGVRGRHALGARGRRRSWPRSGRARGCRWRDSARAGNRVARRLLPSAATRQRPRRNSVGGKAIGTGGLGGIDGALRLIHFLARRLCACGDEMRAAEASRRRISASIRALHSETGPIWQVRAWRCGRCGTMMTTRRDWEHLRRCRSRNARGISGSALLRRETACLKSYGGSRIATLDS